MTEKLEQPTIVRVKRPRNEEPLEALVLQSSKKQKVFALISKSTTKVVQKHANKQKYKVVNQIEEDGIKYMDVEIDYGDILSNLIPMVQSHASIQPQEYVYDEYHYNENVNVSELHNLGWVDWNDVVYLSDEQVSDYDSEDSNAEDYYVNEYPDEDDDNSLFDDSEPEHSTSSDEYGDYY